MMRTPDDAEALRKAAESGTIKRAVIAGGGFIGLEVAENLQSRGIRTTVLDMLPHIMPGFDPEIVDYCLNKDILVLPGCVTPSEVAQGVKRGLKVLKFFPAEQYGGVSTIKAMAAAMWESNSCLLAASILRM